MINSSIRTQLQAKINAATSGTTRSELMLMRVAAQGLNLDETNLDTLIGPKVDSVVAGDSAINFVEAWRALGLDGNVMYPTSFDTQRGDLLYVDPMGVAKKSPYPSGVVACAPVAATFVNTGSSKWDVTRKGGFNPGSHSTLRAAFTLSDGNHLLLAGYSTGSTNASVAAVVVDSAFENVLQDTTFSPMVDADISVNSVFIGMFEVSANVFRVYISVPGTGETSNGRKIGYFSITYNTSTKQVSYSAGAALLTETSGTFGSSPVKTLQGQRYVPVKLDGSVATYCLDLQTATLVKYTSLNSKATTVSPFDHGSAGNEYARVVNATDGVTQIVKAGVNTVQSLPANLTADGCFSSANTVHLVGTGMWLCYNATTRVIKLVKFDSTYATCSIYTVGTLAAVGGEFPLMITQQSDFFVAYGDGLAVSFRWTGSSAPTRINMNQRFPTASAPISDNTHPVDASTGYVAHSAAVMGAGTPLLWSKCYLKFDKAEYLPMATKAFGVVIEGATAGSLSEVALLPGSFKTPNIQSAVTAVHHNGIMTVLEPSPPSRAGANQADSTQVKEWEFDVHEGIKNGVSSEFNGVYATGENVRSLVTGLRWDPGTSGYMTAITPRGHLQATSTQASSPVTRVVALTRSRAAMAVYSSVPKFYKEGPL